jgi:hypothetical protein
MDRVLKQTTLKPQDLLVLFKLIGLEKKAFRYSALAEELGIAASEAHSSVRRAAASRLIFNEDGNPAVQRAAFRDFVLFGARYCFPASFGPPTSGMPTGYAAPPLDQVIVQSQDLPPVWPQAHGPVRGVALCPLYPTVPLASARDQALYERLALFDALRAGAARERELAQQLLSERI